MEYRGFKKQGRSAAVAATFCALVAAVGVTAPVSAAQESAAETWTVPSVKNEILQNAVDSITEAAGVDNVTFNLIDYDWGQVVYNFTNWEVCGQAPSAGREVKLTSKPTKVTLYLKRPSVGC